MKKGKNIYDLFRENEHKLNIRPPERSWRKLERRLDGHRRQGRSSIYRTLGMVAAVAMLVSVVFLISYLFEQQQVNYQASQEPAPVRLEALVHSTDTLEAYKVMEFSRKYQERLSNPIAEGQPGGKLVIRQAKTEN